MTPNKQANMTIVPINQNASCEPPFYSFLLHSFQRTCVCSTAAALYSLSPSSLPVGRQTACVAPSVSDYTTSSSATFHLHCSAAAETWPAFALWIGTSRGQTEVRSVCSAPPERQDLCPHHSRSPFQAAAAVRSAPSAWKLKQTPAWPQAAWQAPNPSQAPTWR